MTTALDKWTATVTDMVKPLRGSWIIQGFRGKRVGGDWASNSVLKPANDNEQSR